VVERLKEILVEADNTLRWRYQTLSKWCEKIHSHSNDQPINRSIDQSNLERS